MQYSGTVKNVERKQNKNGKWGLTITDEANNYYSTLFHPGNMDMLRGLKAGDNITFEFEEKQVGNRTYRNITEVSDVSKQNGTGAHHSPPRHFYAAPDRKTSSAPKPKQPKQTWHNDPVKERSIVLQSCLKITSGIVAAAIEKGYLPPMSTKKADRWDDIVQLTLNTAETLAAEVYERSKLPFEKRVFGADEAGAKLVEEMKESVETTDEGEDEGIPY